jgi:ATP-dependent helicase/nuclease subunit A
MTANGINHVNTASKFKKLNTAQQQAVFSNKTTVVSAGAGSGKTTVLALRYAYLVVVKKMKVENILTLTFTKKAASEMRVRIYAILMEIARKGCGEEQSRARQAIENFSKASIKTLDAYCSRLLHESAYRYGIRPDFSIDAIGSEEIAESTALPFVLAHKKHPAMQELLKYKTPDSVVQLFIEAAHSYAQLTRRASFSQAARKQAEIIAAHWEKTTVAIKKLMGEFVDALENDSALSQSYIDAMRPYMIGIENFLSTGGFVEKKEIKQFFHEIVQAEQKKCIAVCQHSVVRGRVLALLRFVENIQKMNLRLGPKDHPAKDCIRRIKSIYKLFSSLAVFCLQAGLIFSLMDLIDEFILTLIPKKQTKGALTFDDVSQLAVDLLQNNPDIRNTEKQRFKAVMIDEFQDNNELQKNLLYLIAEKEDRCSHGIPESKDIVCGKLFFVGDEKQSIYRFRDADVSVFRKLCSEFAGAQEARGTEINLTTNFRSSPKLIQSFNALCKTIFAPAETPDLPDYEARFVPLKADPKKEYLNTESQPITISVLKTGVKRKKSKEKDPNALDDDEIEAFHTAKRIYSLVSSKKAAPQDIAILFRKGTVQHRYERYLRKFGIPYTSENQVSFFADGPVNDMYALLRLAVYPHDRYSYATMLRSPFINFSFENFSICMIHCSEEPFSEAERDALPLSVHNVFDTSKAFYNDIREKSNVLSCAELISYIWYDCGYRYETLWNENVFSYSELYDYLFELARREDAKGGSLATFVSALQHIKKSDKKLEDMDIPMPKQNTVQLLTIHKSKGLQFPVVFIPSCGNTGRSHQFEGELYKTRFGPSCNIPLPADTALLKDIKRNYFYEYALEEENKQQIAELRRLLYVGMTRAEKQVFFSGHFLMSDNGEASLCEQLMKTVVEKQAKLLDNESQPIHGDKILAEKTFFSLLLPAFCEIYKENDSGSDDDCDGQIQEVLLEEMRRVTRSQVNASIKRVSGSKSAKSAFRPKSKKDFIAAAASRYDKAQLITPPKISKSKISPVSLELKTMFERIQLKKTAHYDIIELIHDKAVLDKLRAAMEQVDEIIGKYTDADEQENEIKILKDGNRDIAKERTSFCASDFGTIAHTAVESRIANKKMVIPPQIDSLITPPHSKALSHNALLLADFFLSTELGKSAQMAAKSGWLKSEYEFVTRIPRSEGKGFFIGGIIDLIFEDESGVTVVDFKTDKEISPGKHIPQMACYYQAAKSIRKKNVRILIYYLRSGKAVDLTQEAINAAVKFSASNVSLGDTL